MKKMKRIWVLALLAAGFALVLGCKNSTSGGGDQTLTQPGGEDDPKAEAVTIVAKGEYKVKVDNQYSQATVSMTGTDKAITVGDLLIVGGTVSVNENTPIGQVYLKIGDMQFDGYWNTSNTESTADYYAVYRATEAQNISTIQIAVQKAEGESVSVLPENTEITLKNFYIMRLPAADLDELAPGVFKESFALEPKTETNDKQETYYGYEATLDISPAVAVSKGKILYGSYLRPSIGENEEYKYQGHYFRFVDGGVEGWTSGSPSYEAAYVDIFGEKTVSFTYTYAKDEAFSWNKTQLGIQGCLDEAATKNFTIKNLSLRVLPSF